MSTETEKAVDKQEAVESIQVVRELVVDIDAEKRGGVKEVAQNEEVIAMAQEKKVTGKSAEKPSVKPSFFVKKSARQTVKVDVLTSLEDGRVVSVSRTGLGIDFEKDFPFMGHTVLEFTFSVPNYEDMSTYRQRSSVYRREAQQMLVDKISLRNFLLVWHLKDWNLTDKEGKKMELSHDKDGSLDGESMKSVFSVHPTILDIALAVLEKDILFTT